MFGQILLATGFPSSSLHCFESGEAAAEFVATIFATQPKGPVCFVSDLQMPGWDGIQVAGKDEEINLLILSLPDRSALQSASTSGTHL